MIDLALFYRLAAGPLLYGINDCASTAAALLLAAGRDDLCGRYRGRYRTARGWLRLIRRDGQRTLEDAVAGEAARLGWIEIAPSDAREADLGMADFVLHAAPGAPRAPAVCARGFWLVRADDGAVHQPFAYRAWRTCRR